MEYVVFEDLKNKKQITNPDDPPVKIHKISCRFYIDRKRNATSVRWYGPFGTIEEAERCSQQLGKPWKRAECCP